MKGISPWAINALDSFRDKHTEHDQITIQKFSFTIIDTGDSLWVKLKKKNYEPIFFRTCFSPGGNLENLKIRKSTNKIHFTASSAIGDFKIDISFEDAEFPILKYSSSLTLNQAITVPFWPRDILTIGDLLCPEKDMGEIRHSQVGNRTGLLYMDFPERSLRMLYFQNLSSLSPYAEQTGTSLREVVGGDVPEIGLALPPSPIRELAKGTEIQLSDALVCFKEYKKSTDNISRDYLDMLASIYTRFEKPETSYQNWPEILDKGMKDLIESPGCWSQLDGHRYFNAYVSDYETPPEIMVQLAVLLPLVDYVEWSGKSLEVIKTIKEGLPSFYDQKLKTLLRWHPAAESKLKGDEEQKMPMVMDSWYLHHPMLNLSRLAIKGDKVAESLFLDSLGFVIKVAKKFRYDWPVFYKMDTLEIIKAETKPGEGGEKDVPGLYAHVMLQAYELTGNKKYLLEAERAANKLTKIGFKLMYQANNTAFSAGALLRLYKITKKQKYLELSYICLASIFQNVQLWECNYGFGKHFPTFFALFPLTDAPYTAVYEEQEVFCAFHDYLNHAHGVEIPESVRLLCAEYIRFLINRAAYYYPPMLPAEMLSDEVKMGEVDRNLWIALEDLHDGTEQNGTVGQEVYGAGNAFGILPRQYIRIEDESFLIFCDAPMHGIRKSKGKITFSLQGHHSTMARLRITGEVNPKLRFTIVPGKPATVKNKMEDLEYFVAADERITISWKRIG
ncbi:hypothetical protein SAMN04488511_11855 [Pedobacter suwonensis]|uniref:Uncharacterized protein n=1 Tax=Pedobacter suwonensis TaxID=332999 RepID=A0A1I0U1C4_9SPHI|nr:hypothetical protein [Pedobacter suwonensis]SFA57919.1 hypothetical protein SAMN04488511_11855 [Pedobacter suwonensis]